MIGAAGALEMEATGMRIRGTVAERRRSQEDLIYESVVGTHFTRAGESLHKYRFSLCRMGPSKPSPSMMTVTTEQWATIVNSMSTPKK